jgi:hypothetical protein
VVLLADAVRRNIFRDLVMDGLLVRLIDLDNLLDLAGEVAVYQVADGRHECTLISHKF